jgi:hypothetical protein
LAGSATKAHRGWVLNRDIHKTTGPSEEKWKQCPLLELAHQRGRKLKIALNPSVIHPSVIHLGYTPQLAHSSLGHLIQPTTSVLDPIGLEPGRAPDGRKAWTWMREGLKLETRWRWNLEECDFETDVLEPDRVSWKTFLEELVAGAK